MDDQNEKTLNKPYATVTIYAWGKPYEVPGVYDEFEDEPTVSKSIEPNASPPIFLSERWWAEVKASSKRRREKLKALGYFLDCEEVEGKILLVPKDREDKSKEILVTDWDKIESLLDALIETGEADPRFFA